MSMTKTITLFRVEDATGLGPYQRSHRTQKQTQISTELGWRHSDWWRGGDLSPDERLYLHPGPDEDPGLWGRYQWEVHPDYQFAFASTDQLGRWFKGELDTLQALECRVTVLEAVRRSTLIGDYQAVYNPKSAQLVRTLSLDEVFGGDTE